MRFKEGDKVRVKKFKERPIGWEIEGKMDHLMGKVVEIKRSTPLGGYNVYDPKHHCEWSFVEDDLEPVNETIVIYRKDREVIAVDKVTGDKAIAKCSHEDTFDFNVGAKLAFDRLMNGNKENITVEDMRKRLELYCSNISCSDCKLKFPTCRCVWGTHFMAKGSDGNYTMSDEEIKAAFNIVFGTGIKELKPKEATKLYNGKIIFTKGDRLFKTGHIYEVKDGRIKTVDYCQLPMREPLKDIEDVKDYFTGNLDGNRKRKKGWSPYTLELMEIKED